MSEGRELATVVEGRLDERITERALEAFTASPPGAGIRQALETAIDIAETDPDAAREALSALRGDPATLERMEASLELGPLRATLALGGAIQLALAELSSPAPNLRGRTEELLRWLEGAW